MLHGLIRNLAISDLVQTKFWPIETCTDSLGPEDLIWTMQNLVITDVVLMRVDCRLNFGKLDNNTWD